MDPLLQLQIASLNKQIENLAHRIAGMDTDPHGRSLLTIANHLEEIVSIQGQLLALIARRAA